MVDRNLPVGQSVETPNGLRIRFHAPHADVSRVNLHIIMQSAGIAPLAARPARQLSIADFAVKFPIINARKAKRFTPVKRLPPSIPVEKSKTNKNRMSERTSYFCGAPL